MHPRKLNHLREVLNRQCVDHFIHCTLIENLSSILENGILPRKNLESSHDVHGYITDSHRLDENTEATSFSVQNPNFEHLQRIYDRGESGEAAILVVANNLILNYPCSFYPRNAAKKEFKYKSFSHWQWSDRFEELFSDDEDGRRVTQDGAPFPSSWTTHADAEVMVFGEISPEYIEQVAIKNDRERAKFEKKFPKIEFIEFPPDWT